ncbi:hypothetical protein PCL_12428 [Purpureocillium lilacinum]|uniref:Uncharacterized protein n=1 Tax=Purpureocillium lilacinum TaxID=33203 RepID=A0A2U3E980_PURLI|nr:hypothetical protein Purlil1_7290 [Purpureocillium lilacinum]PWI71060.1 hypothetical protein PCL_12428 [Purpureocillium lilacinum]
MPNQLAERSRSSLTRPGLGAHFATAKTHVTPYKRQVPRLSSVASLSGSVGGQAREGGAALDDGATSWHLLWFWLGGKVVIIITWSLGKPDNRGLFRAMSPGQRTVRSTGSKVRQAGKLLRAKYSVAVSGLRTAVTSKQTLHTTITRTRPAVQKKRPLPNRKTTMHHRPGSVQEDGNGMAPLAGSLQQVQDAHPNLHADARGFSFFPRERKSNWGLRMAPPGFTVASASRDDSLTVQGPMAQAPARSQAGDDESTADVDASRDWRTGSWIPGTLLSIKNKWEENDDRTVPVPAPSPQIRPGGARGDLLNKPSQPTVGGASLLRTSSCFPTRLPWLPITCSLILSLSFFLGAIFQVIIFLRLSKYSLFMVVLLVN